MEAACEPFDTCSTNTNSYTFKGFTARWLALTAQLVPATAATIWPYLSASGAGAAGQCDGGSDGMTCGMRWNQTVWDGSYGVGQQMSALSAVQANMLTVANLSVPLTAHTGGTSQGNPSAGGGESTVGTLPDYLTRPITTGDKAGAGILTVLMLGLTMGGAGWMVGSTDK